MLVEEVGPDYIILEATTEKEAKILEKMRCSVPGAHYPDTKRFLIQF